MKPATVIRNHEALAGAYDGKKYKRSLPRQRHDTFKHAASFSDVGFNQVKQRLDNIAYGPRMPPTTT
jgi:hypothetical protein